MRRLLLCTANEGKLKELSALLGDDTTLVGLREVRIIGELPETGSSLEENALQKVRVGYMASGLPSLADDTGLEVESLSGRPGVHSARFAGAEKDPIANMDKLLRLLAESEDRKARFKTVLAYKHGDQERLFTGVLNGFIARAPRGDRGFGYDPVFIPAGQEKTLAELDLQTKNAIGHRGMAVRRFLRFWNDP